MKPSLETYLAEARRYAAHAFCYAGLIDDSEEWLTKMWNNGFDVYDAVDELGESLDLERADSAANWGINAHLKFERKL